MTSELRPIEKAPLEGRRLLGMLLAQRRTEAGYTRRPAFARERLPLTPDGHPNTRLIRDIEHAYRDNFPEERLRQLAQAYLVTYESVTGVAHLRVRALVPAAGADDPPGWMAGDEGRSAADKPYRDRIQGRLDLLRGQGTAIPSGAELFPDSDYYAREWDKYAGGWETRDVVWFVADLQRRADGRRNGAGATG